MAELPVESGLAAVAIAGGVDTVQPDDDFCDAVEEEARRLPGPRPGNGNGKNATTAGLPGIDAGSEDLPAVSAKAWGALEQANQPPRLFRFGGDPVRVQNDDHGAPFICPLDSDRLRGEVARAANWFQRLTRNHQTFEKPALPPVPVVKDMLAAPDVPLPVLSALIGVPAFGPDGTLHAVPGYNPATKLFYAPAPDFAVPPIAETPDAGAVQTARALIADDMLTDFPFTGFPERAHAVGLLLLPFVRALIDGPTPLHLIEKPAPGTGASLLVNALFYPALGRNVGAMTEGGNEEEWRKRITAVLLGGAQVVLFDNLRRKLDSAAVSSAITSKVWEDRKMGVSKIVRVPVRCAWVATGNNPALSSEISRRAVRIRLDAKSDRPWRRTGFRHPDLGAWLTENRGGLVWAALTLVRAWLAAGRPAARELPTLGMFESWTTVIGGILEHAGITGFLGNLGEFYDSSDTEAAEVRAFLSAWWAKHLDQAVGVAGLWEIASSPDSCLPLGDKGERSGRMKLGRLLTRLRDRRFELKDGVTVCIAGAGTYQGAQRWRLAGV